MLISKTPVFTSVRPAAGWWGAPSPARDHAPVCYTDESKELNYKPAEEIRKANLRGANLLGANVEGTDFYLVDLRDAKYSPDQAEHFRRCGAILD